MKDIASERNEMFKRMKRNLNFLIKEKGCKLLDFVGYCEEHHNVQMNQGNVSKYLKNDGKMDVLTVSLLCEWLDVEMQRVLWEEMNIIECIFDHFELSSKLNSFIMTNEKGEFNKYKGEYFCYFYPTVSSEEELICGKMKIRECEYTNRCDVSLEINTNTNQQGSEKPYIKKYTGRLMISEKNQVCYCIVGNNELGECNMIQFRHLRLNNKSYMGGMAAVLTISAGTTNVPTYHRMVISEKEILGDDRRLIAGNLGLNWSKILIEKDNLVQVLEKTISNQHVQQKILANSKLKEYYEVSERYLRSLDEIDLEPSNRAILIARIREASNPLKYNKISQRLDENVIEILKNIKQ